MARGDGFSNEDVLYGALATRVVAPQYRQTPSGIPYVIYGQGDEAAAKQLETCLDHGQAAAGALMADHHKGYSQPIGGVVAYEDKLSPSGAGYDLGCGVMGVRTNIRAEDLRAQSPSGRPEIAEIMDQVSSKISFGMGRANDDPVDHPVLDKIRQAGFGPQRAMYDKAAGQLGTVGGGNHYVNIMEDEEGWVWVTAHFGSRGFGHTTANDFLSLAQGGKAGERPPEGDMDSMPVLIPADTDLGQAYVEASALASDYAYAGREVAVGKVVEILGAEVTYQVQEHHNATWREEHMGKKLWVVRKGATPAAPGQEGVIGGSMGSDTVIVEGLDSPESVPALFSTVHGAGRVMSRTAAAGSRPKRRRTYFCPRPGCSFSIPAGSYNPGKSECPVHGKVGFKRHDVYEQKKKGSVDWERVRNQLSKRGIELRGGAADEAPEVYKDINTVLAAHRKQIKINHRLKPMGVAMAGPDIKDPYKD